MINYIFRGSNEDNSFEVRLNQSIVLNAINITMDSTRYLKYIRFKVPSLKVNSPDNTQDIVINMDMEQTKVNKIIKKLHRIHPIKIDR